MSDGCLIVFMHIRVCVIGCACVVVCVDVWVCFCG